MRLIKSILKVLTKHTTEYVQSDLTSDNDDDDHDDDDENQRVASHSASVE